MEALFIIGTILLIIAIIVTIGIVIYARQGLQNNSTLFRSAKAEDFLEKYYEEEYGEP